jgi:hypothetical protein
LPSSPAGPGTHWPPVYRPQTSGVSQAKSSALARPAQPVLSSVVQRADQDYQDWVTKQKEQSKAKKQKQQETKLAQEQEKDRKRKEDYKKKQQEKTQKAWMFEKPSGNGTYSIGGAEKDLGTLITAIKQGRGKKTIYDHDQGSIVGGKKGAAVSGLNNANARIDVQNPPGSELHNVQYQIDDATYATVLFHDDDTQDDVLTYLQQSYKRNGHKAMSPRYQETKDY